MPSPLDSWELDVAITTRDPILIRGNLAKGQITGDARITGTFANPTPNGELRLNQVQAKLPFSNLTIPNGRVILQPSSPLDPLLDIRGTSTIQSNLIRLNLFGPISNPRYALTSDPPLPESEIMTLLATGTSRSNLEDRNTAGTKAFRLLLSELRKKVSRPGGNSAFKNVLKAFENVELRGGQNDPFTGREQNSATLKISRRWFLSASIDQDGHSRGTVIYSFGFR